jgi:hypothetical protein
MLRITIRLLGIHRSRSHLVRGGGRVDEATTFAVWAASGYPESLEADQCDVPTSRVHE